MNTNAIPYQRSRRGDKALIFIHGFLDAGELWVSKIDHEGTASTLSGGFSIPNHKTCFSSKAREPRSWQLED